MSVLTSWVCTPLHVFRSDQPLNGGLAYLFISLSVNLSVFPWDPGSVHLSVPWARGHVVSLILVIPTLGSWVSLSVCSSRPGISVCLLIGCQDSLSVPLDTGPAFLSVCPSVSRIPGMPIGPFVFQSLGCLVCLVVCCSSRGLA